MRLLRSRPSANNRSARHARHGLRSEPLAQVFGDIFDSEPGTRKEVPGMVARGLHHRLEGRGKHLLDEQVAFGMRAVAYKSIDSFDPLLQLHKPN